MGYMLNVVDAEHRDVAFYGGKLYGYAPISECLSYAYLEQIGVAAMLRKRFDYEQGQDDDMWKYTAENRFILTAEQFRCFIILYQDDYKRVSNIKLCQNTVSEYNLKQLIESDSDKELYWN